MPPKHFPRDPALSNAKFESYKLGQLPDLSPPSSTPLPGAPVSPSRFQGKTLLSVREMQSRVRHDHLSAGFGGWVCWIDQAWGVWAAKIGADEVRPFVSSDVGGGED